MCFCFCKKNHYLLEDLLEAIITPNDAGKFMPSVSNQTVYMRKMVH